MKNTRANTWRDQLKVDFSADSRSKDVIRERLLLDLDRRANDMKEEVPMKATMKYSTRVVLIALIAIVLVSCVALAALKTFSLGPFATYTQSEGPTMEQAMALINERRSDWAGRIFDADGNPVDDLVAYLIESGGRSRVYDARGVEQSMDFRDGAFVLFDRVEPEDPLESGIRKFAAMEEVTPLLDFDFALPTSLPDGYALDRFEMFGAADGASEPSGKFLNVVYAKAGAPNSDLYMMLRLMDEETAFESSSSEPMRELTINGRAAVTDEWIIDMLVDDVLYSLFLCPGVGFDELLKMAESIRV